MSYKSFMGYREYSHAGYTFKGAVQKQDSWIRRAHRYFRLHGSFTKLELFERYVPHVVQYIPQWKGSVYSCRLRVTPGWGTSVWSALQQSGFMVKSGERRDGYPVMVPGPNFEKYDRIISILDKVNGTLDWDEINDLVSFYTKDTQRSKWVNDF